MDAHLWDERYAAADLVWSAGPNQFVAAECADLTPGRAVDLAAGEGRNAIWLAQQGWQVTAVDFSQVGLDKGRRVAEATGATGVEWICADATTFVPAGPVDLVVIAYLQVPAADRLAAVTGAVRALRPGGTLLWVSHDATNIAEGTGGPQDPSVLMSAEDVLADAESSGVPVDVARAERVARLVESGDHRGEEQRTAWDALVRLTRR
ncbi:class I SAM-dependent methyltransferase [Nocardioides sp. InS609-2]|uniref:class I SAM-dependent methyltransferase n=1 Tax=Nocardioides sp. InS609-2 TaxID=2760705 RepID=UPI0020C16FF6|nr:class I SAM-dependent methyltransferase [Nocardioides sp. InS609-2]